MILTRFTTTHAIESRRILQIPVTLRYSADFKDASMMVWVDGDFSFVDKVDGKIVKSIPLLFADDQVNAVVDELAGYLLAESFEQFLELATSW